MEETGKSLEDVFSLDASKFKDTAFRKEVLDVTLVDFNIYLIESGVLMLELPNAYNRWNPIAPSNYCVDYCIMRDPMKITPCFWAIVERVEDFEVETALTITMSTYFFYLASFCWLSVLSFDIWWTFRGYAKAPPMYRRQQYFKFLMYSLFAFGVPFLMTAGVYTLNEIKHDMRYLPWFVTPHVPEFGCYFEGSEEQLYLHIPMLILIICNCVFYLMTASKIWRLSRGIAVLDADAAGNTQAHRTHKQRLEVYLKLAVVMGLSWLLELVISLTYNSKILWLSDTNNIFVSLAIFLIFVCKKEILKKLCERCMGRKTMRGCPPAKINSNRKSNPNQEPTTNQLKISSSPHGGNIHTVVSTNVIDSTI